jgi:hypothetical protein
MAVGANESALFKFLKNGVPGPVGERTHIKLKLFTAWLRVVESESGEVFAISANRALASHASDDLELSR